MCHLTKIKTYENDQIISRIRLRLYVMPVNFIWSSLYCQLFERKKEKRKTCFGIKIKAKEV